MKPELIIAAMEELEKYWTDYAATYLSEINFGKEHYVDIVAVNGDLAAQTGPIMSVDKIYSPIIKPIEHRFAKNIHELAQVKINYKVMGRKPRTSVPGSVNTAAGPYLASSRTSLKLDTMLLTLCKWQQMTWTLVA